MFYRAERTQSQRNTYCTSCTHLAPIRHVKLTISYPHYNTERPTRWVGGEGGWSVSRGKTHRGVSDDSKDLSTRTLSNRDPQSRWETRERRANPAVGFAWFEKQKPAPAGNAVTEHREVFKKIVKNPCAADRVKEKVSVLNGKHLCSDARAYECEKNTGTGSKIIPCP